MAVHASKAVDLLVSVASDPDFKSAYIQVFAQGARRADLSSEQNAVFGLSG